MSQRPLAAALIGLTPPSDRSDRLRSGLWIDAAVAFVAVLIVFVFIAEPQPVDPIIYLDAAVDPGSVDPEHRSTRLGVTLPTWVVSLVFGRSEITFYALPIVSMFVLAAATSNLARALFNDWAGPAAALIAVTSPVVFLYSTQLLADIPAAAALAVVVALLLRSDPGWLWPVFISGLVFGYSVLVRETSLLFLPGVLIAMWLLRHRSKSFVWFGAGLGVMAVFELVANSVIWSDPWARLRAIVDRTGSAAEISQAKVEFAFERQSNLLETLTLLPEILVRSWQGRFVLIASIVFLVALLVWSRRQNWMWAVPVVIGSAWVLISLVGAIRPESDRPVLRLILDRYWSAFIPFLSLLAVGALWMVWMSIRRLSARRLGSAVVGLVVLGVAFAGVDRAYDTRPDWFIRFNPDSLREIRSTFGTINEPVRMVIPSRTDGVVSLYAVDLLGRPVTPADFVDLPRGEAEDEWYLFTTDGIEPQVGNGAELVLPSRNSVVYDSSPGLRWRLYRPGRTSAVDLPSPSDTPWTLRMSDSSGDHPPTGYSGGALSIGDGALVSLDPLRSADSEPVLVPPGSVVRVMVTLEAEPAPSLEVSCEFNDASDGSNLSSKPGLAPIRPHIDGTYVWLCESPLDTRSSWRPVVAIRGPAEAQVIAASYALEASGS